MLMTYKTEDLAREFAQTPALLQYIVSDFVIASNEEKIIPVMTRVFEYIEGSSGVHEAGRAVDFRDEYVGKLTYPKEVRERLLSLFNDRYRREDGKATLVWHSFADGPHHWHIQVAADSSTYSRKFVARDEEAA